MKHIPYSPVEFERKRIFNVQDDIIREANFDDRKEGKGFEMTPIPEYKKVKIVRNSTWWVNFFKTSLYQLAP